MAFLRLDEFRCVNLLPMSVVKTLFSAGEAGMQHVFIYNRYASQANTGQNLFVGMDAPLNTK